MNALERNELIRAEVRRIMRGESRARQVELESLKEKKVLRFADTYRSPLAKAVGE